MLGIVILNYKTWQLTVACVNSIRKTYQSKYRIYIVDNASPNESYEKLYELYKNDKNVECILAEANGGFAKGNNLGVKACVKDGIQYAVITNNDIIFQEGCLEGLEKTVVDNVNAVMVAPKILDVNQRFITPPWKRRQSLLQYLNIADAREHIFREEELVGIKKVYMVSGCCFLIDVNKFSKMGAFDENTFLYNEEGILAMQAEENRFDILYNGEVSVIHNHGASTDKGTLSSDVEIMRSGLYYWKTYEKVSDAKLILIGAYFIVRMNIKILFRRVSSENYWNFMKKSFQEMIMTVRH